MVPLNRTFAGVWATVERAAPGEFVSSRLQNGVVYTGEKSLRGLGSAVTILP